MELAELAGIVMGTFILLSMVEFLWCEFRFHQRRRVVLRKYAHTEKILFALEEGETIVGVLEEHKTLCFYSGRNGIEKENE